MDNPTTRISLILRLKNRDDAEAWDEFVNLYEPTILRIARQMGLSNSDAADACQDVLLRLTNVVEKWDHQTKGATFRGWLYRVARNAFLNFVEANSKKLVQTQQFNLEAIPESTDGIDSFFDLELSRQIFARASQKIKPGFSPSNWSAFWLSYVEQVAIVDVAQQLQIEASQVYLARSRVVSRLKTEVARITSGDLSWLANASSMTSKETTSPLQCEAKDDRE